MKIDIAYRFRPFSHLEGSSCALPGTTFIAKCYPTCVEFYKAEKLVKVEELSVIGPVKGFTTKLDLEKGGLVVLGNSAEGYFRKSITLPDHGLSPKERLSLGCHKAQDWDLMHMRSSLVELLPHWHRLGMWLGEKGPIEKDTLASSCASLLHDRDKMNIAQALSDWHHAACTGYFAVEAERWKKFGNELPTGSDFLANGAYIIRRLFLQHSNDSLDVLPVLPPEFHCGRFINVDHGWGMVNLEWSKKLVRRMTIRCEKEMSLQMNFQTSIKTFRLNKQQILKNGSLVQLKKGMVYTFDRFEK